MESLASIFLHAVRSRLTHDFPAQISKCLDELSDEQIWWRPNAQTNSVANLVLHLIGSNRFFLEHVIAGRETVRDRPAEFAGRGTHSKEELKAAWQNSVALTATLLDELDASRLTEITDRSGRPQTMAQILLHASHHNATHMGQIVWITKQLRPGVLDELWMKTRS